MACGGWTLLELVAVLVLLGILAATALPRWEGSALELAARTEQLAMDLRLTQAMAIGRGEDWELVQSGIHGYALRNGAGDVTLESESLGERVSFAGGFVPVRFAAISGLPGGGATLTLTDGVTARTVVITPVTGAVVTP